MGKLSVPLGRTQLYTFPYSVSQTGITAAHQWLKSLEMPGRPGSATFQSFKVCNDGSQVGRISLPFSLESNGEDVCRGWKLLARDFCLFCVTVFLLVSKCAWLSGCISIPLFPSKPFHCVVATNNVLHWRLTTQFNRSGTTSVKSVCKTVECVGYSRVTNNNWHH